jgi:hydrogenase nickel incorporation protein HypB
MTPRILEVRQRILKNNDLQARALRKRFEEAGVCAVSLVSSPGAGKTTLLRQTLMHLAAAGRRVAALVGDLATENDARRLAESGAPVRQIVTATVCHLEAQMICDALAAAGWELHQLDFLFIENVGNLVCPSSYDLGEALRAVLVSTTEGEDKPLKYPTIFNTSDLAVITKLDLAAAAGCDLEALRENIQDVRPGLPVLKLSARDGQGLDQWLDYLCNAAQVLGAEARP